MSFEIVPLKNGGHSLRSLEFGETFHPGTGPAAEARILHVEQQRLLERARNQEPFVIWDVGLGAAANAIAAIEALGHANVEIHSFDRTIAPLEFALSHPIELSYVGPHLQRIQELLTKNQTLFGNGGKWFFHPGDFRESMSEASLPPPQAIFYDPYSPYGNGDMWELAHFTHLFQKLHSPCLLTNYTRSTAVRVTLLLAGFFVGVGTSVGEKAETTIAANRLDLLENPLGEDWLAKVRGSGNAAPLRKAEYMQAPISEEDFEALAAHPQFHFFLS